MSNNSQANQTNKGARGPGGNHGLVRPVEKAKDFKGTLRKLLRYLRPRRIQLIFILIMAMLSAVFSVVGPKVMGKATTKLFEGFIMKMKGVPGASIDFGAIAQILIFLAGLYIISAIFSYLQQYFMVDVTQKTVYDMRKDVNEKLTRLPLKYYDGRTHGEILSRVTNDVDVISSTLQQSVTQLITSLVTIVGVIIMMLTISPLLTIVTIVTLPLSVIATKKIVTKSQQYFVSQQKILGDLNGHIEEMYTGHVIVKAFGYEEKAVEKFDSINEELCGVGLKAQFISGIIMPLMGFINNIGYVLVCIVGGFLAINGKIQIGDIQAFIQYSRQFGQPIVQAANIANIIQSTVAAAERVFEVLEEPEDISDDILKPIENKNVEGNVRFKNVKFGYDSNKILFEDLSIEAKTGQTVAIVGPTGAGKTTLVNLLMRFYEISEGDIYLDNMQISEYKKSQLRSQFGMVLQDTWLFKGSIRDNIAYGRENATEEDIMQAAKAARADHFIRTLPQGYDTELNEEASNISQGQKQLITIARAILADPKILILDEATSSVDTRTELQIQKAMTTLMEGRTNFVIAHRLSTIKNADLILVMNEGSIIEKGTHTELIQMNGFYAELYQSQFVGMAV